jgi:transposase
MGWAYGIDLRQRVVDAIEDGLTHRQAAARFRVAVSTAGNWHRLWRATGSARPGKQGQPRHSKLDAFEAQILAMVAENKDIALYEIADRLAEQYGVRAAPSTVWHFFDKRSITFKKRRRMPASSSAQT